MYPLFERSYFLKIAPTDFLSSFKCDFVAIAFTKSAKLTPPVSY